MTGSLLQPETIALVLALVLLLLDAVNARREWIGALYAAGAVVLFLAAAGLAPGVVYGFDQLDLNIFTQAGRVIIVFFFLVVAFLLINFNLKRERPALYYALTLLSLTGSLLLLQVNNLISFFIVLELATLPSYAIVGFYGKRSEVEAAAKYYLYGAVASAFFAIGVAITAFFAGSFYYADIGRFLAEASGSELALASAGLILALSALAYKVAVFPWQLWSPDVYQGQETVSLMYTGIVPKIAGFGALMALFQNLPLRSGVESFLLAASALTIIMANFAGLLQQQLPRIIAFSSISHAGFMLSSFLVSGAEFERVLLVYLFAYAVSTLALLSVLPSLSTKVSPSLNDIAGLFRASPLAGAVAALAVFSLAGVPPFPGFFAKFYLLSALLKEGYLWLVILQGVMSAVALGYYLPVVRAALLDEGSPAFELRGLSASIYASLALLVGFFAFYLNIILKMVASS